MRNDLIHKWGQVDLLFYNAGTDCLVDDALGRMAITRQGIIQRDEVVFAAAKKHGIPIVMVTSGGYTAQSAVVIAESIENLHHRKFIKLV